MMIKRIHLPSVADFVDSSRNSSWPVIITGAIDQWPAYKNWDADYFASKIGNATIRVVYFPTDAANSGPVDGYAEKFHEMPFDQFLEKLETRDTEKFYLAQQPMDENGFAVLKDDVIPPEIIPEGVAVTANLWYGPQSVVTPLHFDRQDNCLAQVRGRKLLVLFSPADSERLYPFPPDSKISHLSQINLERVDLDAFPKFEDATPLKVVLSEGEMIFIPAGWWHQVHSLSASVSVNFWWKKDAAAAA